MAGPRNLIGLSATANLLKEGQQLSQVANLFANNRCCQIAEVMPCD